MPPIIPQRELQDGISEEEVLLLGSAAKAREERMENGSTEAEIERKPRFSAFPSMIQRLMNSPCGLVTIAMCTVIFVTIIFVVRRSIFFNVLYEDGLFKFLTYIQDLDMVSGPVVFAIVYATCIVFFLPVTILNLASGFCFGVMVGFATVSIGGIAGASLSFILGRTIARDWVSRSAFHCTPTEHGAPGGYDSAFSIRLCFIGPDAAAQPAGCLQDRVSVTASSLPALPIYAMTNVPFWTYFWATWLGLAPGTFAYVYMGSAVRNLADVVSGQHAGGPVYFTVLALGVFGTFAVAIYLMREGSRVGSMFAIGGSRSRSGSASPRMGAEQAQQHSRRRSGGQSDFKSSKNSDSEATPESTGSKGKSLLEEVITTEEGREIKRDGDFILFSGNKKEKKKKRGSKPRASAQGPRSPPRGLVRSPPGVEGRQRTLTRNSSLWSLFNSSGSVKEDDTSQYQAETRQLEYFL